MITQQIEKYTTLYHGTSVILKPGVDFLIPKSCNVQKVQAVFATSFFPKALACALLSKQRLQNEVIGRKYYSYLWIPYGGMLILHPSFNWDNGAPAFVYELDKHSFYQSMRIRGVYNEYFSFKPVKINAIDEEISPEFFQQRNLKLFRANSVNELFDLHKLYGANRGIMHMETIKSTCQRII